MEAKDELTPALPRSTLGFASKGRNLFHDTLTTDASTGRHDSLFFSAPPAGRDGNMTPCHPACDSDDERKPPARSSDDEEGMLNIGEQQSLGWILSSDRSEPTTRDGLALVLLFRHRRLPNRLFLQTINVLVVSHRSWRRRS
jgi:hypothetical protein